VLRSTLCLIPCGQRKIWDRYPRHGPAAARDAYTSTPFALNRAYAERFADAWLILSARYGFIPPDFPIPGPYNVTFKRPQTQPIDLDILREQVHCLKLSRHADVVVLGGAAYRHAVQHAFAGTASRLSFPTAGLPIGKAMQAIRRALDSGTPLPAGVLPP
jgi:hypothetical protein